MPLTVLTNAERRAVANLSIPRNATDLAHMLRQDPHAPNLTDSDAHQLLSDLEASGLVVNIGEHDTPGKAAAHVDRHQHAVSMPDEKARIYEGRLSLPHRRWRTEGDLWHMTDAGLETLTAPIHDEPPAKSLDEIEVLLRSELQRVKEVDPSHPSASIAGHLTPQEYSAWAGAVCDEHEARTGIRPRPPIAGGAGYSDAYEVILLDAENQKSSITASAPWYMALVTVAVTDADTGTTITEANYTGYARKSVAAADMNSAASGSATNANAITFAACTAGSSTVIGFAHCSASTVGTMRKYGTCTSTTVSTTQTPAQFAAAAYTTTLD